MDNNYRHIELHFDVAKQPKFIENKAKGYVLFGDDNDYPKYLLSLYNESPKHGAIVKSKATYVYGKGMENAGIANSKGESWNDILKKCIQDDEIYRGYYLQVIWNRAKQISDIYHIDFQKVRVSGDLMKYYVKNDWSDNREKARCYDAFNVNEPYGSQIIYVKEYNPTSEVYPLPSYFQALNMIESDIEVSRHILANAKRGWVGNTLINLNNGDPISEENKGDIERALLKKFTGSDGKRVVIMFNKSKDNAAEVVDLGNSILTKEDFTNINNLIQQEIFAAHQITSSELFGISVAGSLGSRSAMRDAYEIWNNTYCQNRQAEFNAVFQKLRSLKGEIGEFKIIPVEPLKFEFTENIMSANMTQDEIRSIMGLPPMSSITNIPTNNAVNNADIQTNMDSNDSMKNLTGRQMQNIMRISRHYAQGKLSLEQAKLMLRSGYGLTEDDIHTFLGIDVEPLTDSEVQQFASQEDDRLYDGFQTCGEDISNYEIVRSIPMGFDANESINQLQANILNLISKDKRIDVTGMMKALDESEENILNALKVLKEKKIIDIKTTKVGSDTIIERSILKPLGELEGKNPKPISEVYIRYTYEWRVEGSLKTSRPFCVKLWTLSAHKNNPSAGGRTWSMEDIQNLSMRMGYSVLDRCGGFWNNNGVIEHQCRHEWVANIVTKKK